MSFVGTRPEATKYVEKYSNEMLATLLLALLILTSLKIMEVMMARKKKLSELSEGFTVYPQVLTNVRVTDKKAAQDDTDVQAAVKKVTEELGDTGRILVRESGTEPVVRVMVEAESEALKDVFTGESAAKTVVLMRSIITAARMVTATFLNDFIGNTLYFLI